MIHYSTITAADPSALVTAARLFLAADRIIWGAIERGLASTGAARPPAPSEVAPGAGVDEVIMLTRRKLAEFHEEQRKLLAEFPKTPPLE